MMRPFLVSLPDATLLDRLRGLAPDAAYSIWDLLGPAPAPEIDLVVPPYMGKPDRLARLAGTAVRLIQSQSIGYEGVAEALPPGLCFANAASVHETSTAELALALMLAAQRGIPDFVRAQGAAHWAAGAQRPSLADRTVLIIGYGGVGVAIEQRLIPFETNVLRVGSRARQASLGPVHAAEDLPSLVPEADVVVLAVPLTAKTRGLVDAAFLDAMRDDALLVNVARGPVVDAEALLAALHGGRIRAALDVTEPEPLPDGHPLWSAPNLLISPHVGGASSAMAPRMARLIARQIARLRAGEEPLNVVIRS